MFKTSNNPRGMGLKVFCCSSYGDHLHIIYKITSYQSGKIFIYNVREMQFSIRTKTIWFVAADEILISFAKFWISNKSIKKQNRTLFAKPATVKLDEISTTISFLSLTFAYMVLVVINYYILTYSERYHIFAKLEQLHLHINWGVEFH